MSPTLNLHGHLLIKAEYGVSVGAVIMRARDLGVIDANRARSLQIQLPSQGWRTNELVPVADEMPLLLVQALRKVYGPQAVAKAAHGVGTSPDWISQWTHSQGEPESATGTVIDFAARRLRSVD